MSTLQVSAKKAIYAVEWPVSLSAVKNTFEWKGMSTEALQNRFHRHMEVTRWKCRCGRHAACEVNLGGACG